MVPQIPRDPLMNNLTKIKDSAENKIRLGGFNNFSFREIADEIGIKSSSVHYHFPTKPDLAAAVARRYTDRFMLALDQGKHEDLTPQSCLELYIGLFRQALHQDKKMCLCGSLAAQSAKLPETVQFEAKRFFELNINWLCQVFLALQPAEKDQQCAQEKAVYFISVLEGVMLTCQITQEAKTFDLVAKQLLHHSLN